MSLDLYVVSETPQTLTLGHAPVPGAIGFRLQPFVVQGQIQPGKWSHTWNGAATTHRFAPGFPRDQYRVEALMPGDMFTWPEDPPTGPPFFSGDIGFTTPMLTG